MSISRRLSDPPSGVKKLLAPGFMFSSCIKTNTRISVHVNDFQPTHNLQQKPRRLLPFLSAMESKNAHGALMLSPQRVNDT